MRKFALAFVAATLAAPAIAQDAQLPEREPIVLAQQGPYVVRAPRYITDPNEVRQPRKQNARRQPQRQQWDQDETSPRHYVQAQPAARYQQQQPQHYYAPQQRQQQPQYYYAPQQQQQPANLGGGFIEFLVTGRSGPAIRQDQPQQQGDYYPPQQQQYYQQQQQQQYYQSQQQQQQFYPPQQQQQPAYYQQQPMDVARVDPQERPQRSSFDPRFERADIEYKTEHPVGSIIIDTRTRYLYLVQPNGRAIRYGVGVGRPGFEWKGVKTVSAKKEWPDWRPPEEMRKRQPYLPEHMPGGPNNPLGARALYLGSSLYRIHGSNEPHTIGSAVSSGCFRMRNQDVIDLYNRVKVGARVVVL